LAHALDAAHGVIFFRDQRLTAEQHIAFAALMGTININRFFKTAPNYPQIAEVRKEAAQRINIGRRLAHPSQLRPNSNARLHLADA
jgi:alpha-ketoglutarate-dependent taurine dioxygenase